MPFINILSLKTSRLLIIVISLKLCVGSGEITIIQREI